MSERRPICDYDGSDYQERFWAQGGRAYEDGAEAIALGRLLPVGGARMLEVGAGAGRNTERYEGFAEITLLDYSRTQLEQARRRLGDSPRYRFVVADVCRMPFAAGVFDGATMIRTLHHMQDPVAALRSVREVLSSGAFFLLEYPNKRNLKAIGRWLLRRQAWSPFDPTPVEFARLNFDFHPSAVRSWLGEAMFHVEHEVPVSHLRIGWVKRFFPERALLALEGALQRLGQAWLYAPSVFVATRASGRNQPPYPFAWRCPTCGSEAMVESADGIRCGSCERQWPKRDGIYEFRE